MKGTASGRAGASEVARIASLSRIFIGVRPGFARNLGRVAKPSGPLSVVRYPGPAGHGCCE